MGVKKKGNKNMPNSTQNPFLEREQDIKEYLSILYNRRWLIISFTLVLCTISLIRTFMMRPVYEATTKILIQKKAPRIIKIDEMDTTNYSASDTLFTQYKILESDFLAEKVFKTLGDYIPWDKWHGRKKINTSKPLTDLQKIETLLSHLKITPIPNTELVLIKFEDIDPVLSAKIANLWANSYISYILDTRFDVSSYASGWLDDKIKEEKNNLETAEKTLQEYRKANTIIIDTVDEEHRVLNKLLAKKSELEVLLSEKQEYYKAQHPEILGIKSELESIVKTIANEKTKELKIKDIEIEYNILLREVETRKEVYESLLKRIRETEITGGLKTTNVSILDIAQVPTKPTRPNKKLSLIITLFISVLSGSALAFLIEALDQTLKTPEDIKKFLNIPPLAGIPLPRDEEDKLISPEFITSKKPRSTIAEAYRSLRTSILFTAIEHKRKSLLLTSSCPQEGKTTTAINLAVVMAMAGEKTLLVDADLRQPRIEKVFNLKDKLGLSDVLIGNAKWEQMIIETNIKNLFILPAGSIPPNPSELLGSGKMTTFLEDIDKKYDRIIIDSPPVLAVTDAVILSGKVDGTIIVARASHTHRHAICQAKELIETVDTAHIVGMILNMVSINIGSGYYYYYYGKYGKYGKTPKKNTTVSAS
ncbi:chain-length determining protein [Candidatus Omnitrophus magneticus]|uniref:non-specific protein-tyrosine kinase n=1 Tax=Candidatus Omnitrophus magneticus TaxID=1609969 RepID=A0A0F0CSR3_9BACT|nr:chain-length determining protein [Candidatus Omnitrophus magneticus]